ncbi:MAG: glycosyltransferase family 9 protein [Rikenellaceae bacterium]
MEKNTHILIMRLSAMGDVIMSVAVVKALRESYPECEISVLTRGFFAPFFEGIDNIKIISPDLKGRHKGIVGLYRLYKDICADAKVDYVADFHDVLRTKLLRLFFKLRGKKIAVINKGRAEKDALTRKFRKVLRPLKPMMERYCDVLKSLGFDKISLDEKLKKQKRPVPECVGKKKRGEKWVAYAPFAQHKGKVYPSKHSNELTSLLSENFDRIFIFGGGDYERQFAEYMQSCYDNVSSVIGVMSLSEEIDLMANMNCVVSMDSSSMHMSSLVGVPVVSIWGATHPYAGFYGFNQKEENAVQVDLECRPCSVYGNKACMHKDYRCLMKILPEKVLEKVKKIV